MCESHLLRLYFGIFQPSVVTFHTLPPAPSHFIRILLRAQGLLEDHNPIRGDDVLHNEMATGSSSEVRTMQHVACRSPHGSLWGGFEETAAVQLPHSSKVKRCLSDVLTSPFGMVFGCKSKSELSIGFYFSKERSLSIFLVFTCPQLQSWI